MRRKLLPVPDEFYANSTVVIKSHQFAKKQEWLEVPIATLPHYFSRRRQDFYESGHEALWMQARVAPSAIETSLLPWLDVESPKHDSIESNIEVAQNLFLQLEEYGLANELVVGLSGRGLRFIWPYFIHPQLNESFQSFVKDDRFVGIDPCLQSNGHFARVLAYRNNPRQGSQKDVHIEYLAAATDLLALTKDKYLELVSGKPSFVSSLETLPRLLPKGSLPDPWVDFLSAYRLLNKLRQNVLSLRPPQLQGRRKVDWLAIDDHLIMQGIKKQEVAYRDFKIFRLSTCPSCGEKEGNPYLTENGWLKCFRSNNCDAGASSMYRGKYLEWGLPPSRWVPGYKAMDLEEDQSTPDVSEMTVEDAREVIRSAIRSGENCCIRASAGVGKTTTTLQEILPLCVEQLVLYTVPTNELAEEIYEAATQQAAAINLEVNIKVLHGRNEDNCSNFKAVRHASSMGYFPALVVCALCANKKKCEYAQEIENIPSKGLVITSHHKALYLGSHMIPDLWVIDESPTDVFLHMDSVGLDEFYNFVGAMSDKLDEALDDATINYIAEIEKFARKLLGQVKSEHEQGRLYVTLSPFGEWEDTDDFWDLVESPHEFWEAVNAGVGSLRMAPGANRLAWELKLFKTLGVDKRMYRWFEALLAGGRDHDLSRGSEAGASTLDSEGYSAYIKVQRAKKPIQFITHYRQVPEFGEDCRVVMLDATADPSEVDALFDGKLKMVEARVPLVACRKVWLKVARGKIRVGQLPRQQMASDMRTCLEQLPADARRVLLLTHKDIEEKLLSIAKDIAPDKEIASAHFWASRGINAYEEFDACVSYGTPTASVGGVIDKAMALFEDRKAMEAWMAQLGPRDLTQSVNRIRPVYGSKHLVVMGSYWPTDQLGDPDLTQDLTRKGNDFDEALERLRMFLGNAGFVTRKIACMLGIGCREDKDDVETWQRIIAGDKGEHAFLFVPTLIRNILIRVRTIKTRGSVILPGNDSWSKLVHALHAESGIPVLRNSEGVKGKPSLCVGNMYVIKAFHELAGMKYIPERWALEKAGSLGESRRIERRALQRPILASLPLLSVDVTVPSETPAPHSCGYRMAEVA